MLQQPKIGGEFQYTLPFRNEENEEETYRIANKVVNNNDDEQLVNTLEFAPGTTPILLSYTVNEQ